jgi:integral membrane protein
MLNWFKKIALLEGISYLFLLFIAMPLKYFSGFPIVVTYTGMFHGILTILFVIFLILLKEERKWSIKECFIILFASFIPFGTFWVDKKYLNQSA